MSQRFTDLQAQAESLLVRVQTAESQTERRALLHKLRALIDELDLEVEKNLAPLLAGNYHHLIEQIEFLN